ncbi:N-formylglutamate deformylase [Dyella marensis]|uniref:N-formylglutamate deformylase n=2 Tax=Rhodanobacteraceae TaxID=1775411 RepID=A0A1I2DDX7_9GAMM|nr:N-formylglutamate deformylase [Dyella marensis]
MGRYTAPMDTYTLHQGSAPLLISLPHDGSFIPESIAARLHPSARRAPDTDWHVGRLYQPLAQALGASVIRPRLSRYVVDLNRPADGHALYPGQRETGLVSTIGFDGVPLYLDGQAPDAAEVQQRVNDYWRPYHQALAQEIARLLDTHGRVVVWEGHSIRSLVPMLFEGRLPDLNLGTADGASCAPALQERLAARLEAQSDYAFVVNGRFKGGYITRQYAQPEQGVQTVQLELAQLNYMDEDSFAYDEAKAARLQPLILALLRECVA